GGEMDRRRKHKRKGQDPEGNIERVRRPPGRLRVPRDPWGPDPLQGHERKALYRDRGGRDLRGQQGVREGQAGRKGNGEAGARGPVRTVSLLVPSRQAILRRTTFPRATAFPSMAAFPPHYLTSQY